MCVCGFGNRGESECVCGGGGILSGFPTDTKTASLVDREQWYSKIIIQMGDVCLWGLHALIPKRRHPESREQKTPQRPSDEFAV